MSHFIATPTQSAFMLSPSYVRVLAGPIGGGKSVACAHELFRWASEQKPNARGERKTRFLIVRNTADQLRSTTMKTVFDWFPPGTVGEWKATEKTLYIRTPLPDGTKLLSEWMAIALDTPEDVRKALSLEATGLWGNECRELHPDVVDGLLMRVNRYPSMKDGGATRAGAIFDTNMPQDDSWWQQKMDSPPANWSVHIQPEAAMLKTSYIAQHGEEPPEDLVARDNEGDEWVVSTECDNFQYLARNYYPMTLEGKTKDFINVYLRCKYGRNLAGFPVYEKTFLDVHLADSPLRPINSPTYPITVGLDFGRTPAATFLQMDTRGRVNVLSEVTSENMGLERFLEVKLRPHIYERYQGLALRVAPDPAGWQKTQVGEVSPADVLKAAGFVIVKPPTNDPKKRIEAVERLLVRFVDGKPGFVVDKTACPVLTKGFRTGYRWKMNRKGEMEGQSPEKNEFSHPHDALQYAALMLDATVSGYGQPRVREIKPAPRRWAR